MMILETYNESGVSELVPFGILNKIGEKEVTHVIEAILRTLKMVKL